MWLTIIRLEGPTMATVVRSIFFWSEVQEFMGTIVKRSICLWLERMCKHTFGRYVGWIVCLFIQKCLLPNPPLAFVLSTCFRVINDALLWNSDDFCHCSSSGSFQLSFSLQFGGICRFPCLIPLLHELRLLRGMAKINVRSIFGIGIYFFFLYANMFAFLVWMSTNDQTDQGK